MTKKPFFQRKENRRAVFISLLVALFLIAVEGIRWVVNFIVVEVIGTNEAWGYFISFIAALVLILLAIVKFPDFLDE